MAKLFSAANPASLYSTTPFAHPGTLHPEWLPRRGTVAPKIAPQPQPVVVPVVHPENIVRGLGWGLVISLSTAWLDSIDAQVKGQLDYQGEPYPTSNEAQLGQVVLAVAQACARADAETKPQLAPQLIPRRKRTQTEVDEKSQEGPVKRWRIFAHTRAGKVKRQ